MRCSEEIYDYSKGQIIQVKAQHLKDALFREFAPIYELLEFVFENAGEPSLINQALQVSDLSVFIKLMCAIPFTQVHLNLM